MRVCGTARRGVKFLPKIKFSRGRSPRLFGAHQHYKMESYEMDKRNSKSYGSIGMEEKQEF
jgi:hypothetical protein